MEFSTHFEKFSNFQKSSKHQNLSIWGIVSTEKSGFLAKKIFEFFRTGLNRSWPNVRGANLAIFEAGGSKSRQNEKKSKKVEKYQNFTNDENIKNWVLGVQF